MALCDSFNTPVAMRAVSSLIAKVNTVGPIADDTLLSVARWATKMVTIFGLDVNGDLSDTQRIGWSGVTIPNAAVPFIYPLSKLRDTIRQQARSTLDHANIALLADRARTEIMHSTADEDPSSRPYRDVFDRFYHQIKSFATLKASVKGFLTLCDQVRDNWLPELGIYIEDHQSLPAIVRPLSKSLAAAFEERKAIIATKSAEAQARRDAEESKKHLLTEKAKLGPFTMFRNAEYSKWDEQGIPIKNKDGKEVTKSQRKKLVKEWEKQKKLHEGYVEKIIRE